MTAPGPNDSHDKDPLSQIRHDLKTPINQIIGYSEMLAEDAEEKGDTDTLADLAKIGTAARTLLELIDKELRPGKIALPSLSGPPAPAPSRPPEPKSAEAVS
ncbi:MAG: histidine kinase dimerization/phospho-acceptor domain-containing protein, partial [Vicinamibacteria bacterium]